MTHDNSSEIQEATQSSQKPADPTENTNKRKEKLLYRFGNLQGQGTRESQEDAFAFSNVFDPEIAETQGILAIVADGMGGMQDGKLASDTAVSVIRQGFQTMDPERGVSEQLNELIHYAGKQVEYAVKRKGGSTVISAILLHDRLYFASLGDSYLFLKRGEYLARLNRFHNIFTDALEDLIDSGQTNPEKAIINDKPSALTEFLGKNPISSIDGFDRPLKIRYGDVLLLCSDGIGGVLTENAILYALSQNTPSEMCTCLEEEIKTQKRRHQDNYTALVIQCVYPE